MTTTTSDVNLGPNLASYTGTQIETAAKHQIAVRVSTDHLLSWIGYDNNQLLKEKHAFSMAKEDITIGVGRPIRRNEAGRGSRGTRGAAYPLVVTTLARMEQAAKNYLVYLFHNPRTFLDRDAFVLDVERNPQNWDSGMSDAARRVIAEMPDFYFCGVSVGFGHAHPNNGDTVASTMIGGLRTVMNGAFEVRTGDPIQWYWACETYCFDADGFRHPPIGGRNSQAVTQFLQDNARGLSEDSARRKAYYDRENGVYTSAVQVDASSGMGPPGSTGKREIAYVKTLRHNRHTNDRHIWDECRYCARAITGARPFEKFDIMIFRQSH